MDIRKLRENDMQISMPEFKIRTIQCSIEKNKQFTSIFTFQGFETDYSYISFKGSEEQYSIIADTEQSEWIYNLDDIELVYFFQSKQNLEECFKVIFGKEVIYI